VLGPLTVEENLLLGAYTRRDPRVRADLAATYNRFPRLAERRHQLAGSLSGGEQQMLAIGRALLARPRLLMLDEPSLGLAPLIVAEVFRIIADLKAQGSTILLVEQNARRALAVADTAYVLEGGRITRSGPAATLRNDPGIVAAYLGHLP
jgi:branched-chain amino acid transport system ATP-binding protein